MIGGMVVFKAALVVSLLALFGCGKKAEQCNSVATVSNVGVTSVGKLKLEKPTDFEEGAKILEKTASDMKALAIADAKLKSLNDAYADSFAARATLMRQVAKATDETLDKGVKDINAAISNEYKLVDQITAYCKE